MRIALKAALMTAVVATAGAELGAHITVQPREVAAGSSQEFLVRVPTEKDQPTTSVRMVFPEGFEVLRVRPTSGWKNEFERDAAGRITGITWSGGRVGRAEYEVFSFMGRAKAPGTVKLDAYQTYGENDVVAWVNPAEPRPAPQVTVVAPPPNATIVASGATAGTDPFASSGSSAATGSPASEQAPAGDRMTLFASAASLVISLAALFTSWRATSRSRP